MSEYRQSVARNKALVCRFCDEITWVNGLEVLSLQREFHVCKDCKIKSELIQ